jgi:hypothetical protein
MTREEESAALTRLDIAHDLMEPVTGWVDGYERERDGR